MLSPPPAGWLASPLADGPPLDPSADQARELLRHELADPVYRASPSLLERVRDWFAHLVESAASGLGLPPVVLLLALVLVLLGVALLLVWTVRVEPGRAARRGSPVFEGATLTAADHRRAAQSARARGDWSAAVVESFRAIAAGAAERGILDLTPGMTAMDVEGRTAAAFPQEGTALEEAATVFELVRYGGQAADEPSAGTVAATEERLRAARPEPHARPGAVP